MPLKAAGVERNRFVSMSKETNPYAVAEVAAVVALFYLYAGDPPPAVNEAHYLVKAKNFWDPSFCANDLFAASGKAHVAFYVAIGWLTKFTSLSMTAWIGRLLGWTLLAIGLQRCSRRVGLPPFAALSVATMWLVGIEYGNLAGEWVVGGIEGKVPAYGLVLIGMSEIAHRNWSRAWIWFGAGAAFHVLTGGWAVVAATFAFWKLERSSSAQTEPNTRFFSVGLFIGGLLSLVGLVPAAQLTFGTDPEVSAAAARIYSYVRIRHHLLPADFPAHWFVRHGLLVIGLIVAIRWKPSSDTSRIDARENRLLWFGIGAAGIAAIGLMIGILPYIAADLGARLLRFYWFRLSDAIVPLVLAIWLTKRLVVTSEIQRNTLVLARSVLIVAVVLLAWTAWQRTWLGIPPSTSHQLLGVAPDASIQQQRSSHLDWVAVCHWARMSTPKDETFLTPRHQQTFKWYAHRAEVVNWKDVPQDAASLLQWNDRFEDVFPKQRGTISLGSMRVPIGYSHLRRYRDRYNVRMMIVDNRIATKRIPLVKVYPVSGQSNETYSVYELPYD